MRRRRYYFIAGILLLCALAYAVFARPAEPSYQGRTLRQWLEERPAGYSSQADAEGKSEFAKAILHMGDNAMPFLVNYIKSDLKAWQIACITFVYTNYPNSQMVTSLVSRFSRRQMRQIQAMRACVVLGPRAEQAVVPLSHLLGNRNYAVEATIALAYIGEKGFPPILMMLTNRQAACPDLVAFGLGRSGTNALPAISTLIQTLQATNELLAERSAFALGVIHQRPELTLPALQKALSDPRPPVRGSVIEALGCFGRSATPILLQSLTDPDPTARAVATNVLRQLDPLGSVGISPGLEKGADH